jgi:hypothetical protein
LATAAVSALGQKSASPGYASSLQLRQGLKLKQATEAFNRFEMLSLLEPHKWRLNSLTMVRMLSPSTEKLYSVGP